MWRWIVLLLFCAPLLGQNPVVISGTITDAGGNLASSGTVEFDVQPVSSSIHYYVPGVTAVAPQTVICSIQTNGTLLNTAGNGPCQVWGNDVLAPANSTYTVTFSPSGQETNAVPQECITGTSYNLNNPVFCPAVSVIPQYSSITAPVIQGNLIPAYNGTFTIGNAQAYYSNIFVKNITFPANTFAPGCLLTGGTTLASTPCLVSDPTGTQPVNQPVGTSFNPNVANLTFYASEFPGADAFAKANAAAAAMPAGSIGVLGGGKIVMDFGASIQTVSTQLLAAANAGSPRNKPIDIEFDPSTIYVVNTQFSNTLINQNIASQTSGYQGACAIPVGQGSSLRTPGLNTLNGNIQVGPSAKLYDLVCNAFQDGTQESLLIDGLALKGNENNVIPGSLLHLVQLFSETKVQNFTTYYPFGNAVTLSGGGQYVFFNNNLYDEYPYAGCSLCNVTYPGHILNLNGVGGLKWTGGSIQGNGLYNAAVVMQNTLTSDGRTPTTGVGTPNLNIDLDGIYFELESATIGSFTGHDTNVDPIQILDPTVIRIKATQVAGNAGGGASNQTHLIDLTSSGGNGQARGPVDFEDIRLGNQWAGLCVINNTETGYVSPSLSCVKPTTNGSGILQIGRYRWNGSDTSLASTPDYNDVDSFTKVTSQIINGSQNPFLTSISAAITAAGSTGSVTIPPYYTALDYFQSNPNGIGIHDDRPLTNTNRAVPLVDAAQYGAICSGSSDDTVAIQNALITANYAFSFPAGSVRVPVSVVLPQGTCTITTPLSIGPWGQLKGEGAGTFLVGNYYNWRGTNYTMIEITSNGALIGGSAAISRTFGDMNIIGVGANTVPSATAFQVANYANVYDACNTHCLANLNFQNMEIQNLDTAFDLEDALNTNITNVFTSQVRNSWNLNGDVIQTFINNSYAEVGSWAGTSNHSTTNGLLVTYNSKYSANCATHTQYCAPQGVFLHHSSIVSFDNDVDIEQCTQCVIDHNTLDLGAGGAGGSGSAITLGGYALGGGLWIDSNTLGTNKASTYLIYSQAATLGTNIDGLWITNNHIFDYVAPTATVGVVFGGASPIRQVHVIGNNFSQLTEGVASQQNLLDSEFRGNSGETISTALINLVSSGTPDYTGTVLDGNTDIDSVPVILDSGATNYVLGYNRSPNQITGRFQAIGSGCPISAGAIGNNCSTTVGLPYTFPDTTYQVAGCTGQGTSHDVVFGSPTTLTTSGFTINEIAMTTSATSGGSVYCTVVHQ